MTFLQPAILWGLLAISIPIIIHFFNLQRPKEILFSNVAFVREVKKTVVRRLKFKQWLILLMRILAISCLVLAFANPVIVDEDQKLLLGNRSVAIVLDNSYSMTASNEKGAYYQQAISMARNILRAYTPQDEFLLMSTHHLKLNYNFANQEEVLEELRELEIRQNTRSHAEILGFQEEIFSHANNGLRELYVISDFQQSTVMADSQSVRLSDSLLFVKYIPLASREQNNVYVSDHKIGSQILEKDKPIQLSMTLVNDGKSAVNELSVRIWLEGKVVALNNSQLEAQSSKTLSLPFTPTQSGWQSGYIELDDNSVDFDNRRYFSIYIPEQEKVLVVEGQASKNMRILYESVFDQFDASFISTRNLSNENLVDYKSIILLGITEISTGLSDRLQAFLTEGGSLMFFPGEEMKLDQVNAFLANLQLGKFADSERIQEGSQANIVDLEHPLFKGIFTKDRSNRTFDAIRIFQYYPLSLNNNTIQNRIMSLENQAPMLLESRVGEGIMFTFSFFPGDNWTDFHIKPIFVPILFRATQIMNQTQHIQSGQEIGAFVPQLIRTSEKELIKLVDENGQEIIPEQYPQGGVIALKFEKQNIKEGNYQLYQEEELLEHLSFNVSDQESKLAYIDANQLSDRLQQKGLEEIEVLPAMQDAISNQIQIEKEGIPLWKYFIILVLVFLTAEILILQLKELGITN